MVHALRAVALAVAVAPCFVAVTPTSAVDLQAWHAREMPRVDRSMRDEREPEDRTAAMDAATFEDDPRFAAVIGRALFERTWVPAPSSAGANDGLGPHFDARSCADCHQAGGRGRLEAGNPDPRALVTRLVRPGSRDGDPVYGRQLQSDAVPGLAGEARVTVRLATGERGDRPGLTLDALAYGPLHPDTRLAARRAPSLAGLGRLAAVDAETIRRLADPDDRNGDGVSGRLAPSDRGDGAIGRFGLKATAATLEDMVAEAFQVDLGLSSAHRPGAFGDCTGRQNICLKQPHGAQSELGEHELPNSVIELVTRYIERLPSPRPLPDGPDPSVASGRVVFVDSGCAACHVPALPLASTHGESSDTVEAYTDLLLHDLGVELAEGGLGELDPRAREWRTAPLWGLTRDITGGERTGYLHDGRAATPMAAIGWHGGEAAAARKHVRRLAPDRRRALARFLDAL